MAYDADGNWIPDDTNTDDPLLNQINQNQNDQPPIDPFSDQYVNDLNQQLGGGTDGGGLLSGLGGLGGLLQSGLGYLSPLFGSILGGPGGKGWGSTIPGMLALAYASQQGGVDTSRLRSVYDTLGGNTNAVVRAATDPIQSNLAAGYGDLLQSQAKRGIRGSSFGDTAISDFMTAGNRSLGNAAANASQGALSLQGSVAGNIATLDQKSQELKNNLYGRAFDTLGRGLNPSGYGMLPAPA